MIFQGIDFHNVEEMEQCEKGYRIWRLPKWLREKMNDGIRNTTSRYSTGVELRFVLKSDSADIILRAESAAEASVAYIFRGSIQGGWQTSSVAIGTEETKIPVTKADNIELLKKVTKQANLPFSPEVIRIVLPYNTCYFVGVEGEVEPPTAAQLPGKTYLAYGSSITHGSLALAQPYSYAFRIAQKLKCDYLNFGFAGSAHLEAAMAEYIVSRKDWDFASLELGINMVSSFSVEEFERRVARFAEIFAGDSRKVFVTDIFGTMDDSSRPNTAKFREIVEKYAADRFIYTRGAEILNRPEFISADGVHPSLEGVEEIVNHWSAVMERYL